MRNSETKRLGSREIDDQIELGRLLISNNPLISNSGGRGDNNSGVDRLFDSDRSRRLLD